MASLELKTHEIIELCENMIFEIQRLQKAAKEQMVKDVREKYEKSWFNKKKALLNDEEMLKAYNDSLKMFEKYKFYHDIRPKESGLKFATDLLEVCQRASGKIVLTSDEYSTLISWEK